MGSEEVGEAQKGPDHLGVGGGLPLTGSAQLRGGHVDLPLGDLEAHNVGRVCTQRRSVIVQLQMVILQNLKDPVEDLKVVVPSLVVDDDAVDVNQDSIEVL